ncbi:hypothetical protein BCV69DRAFT_136399 [Microstroma glucosiphilum]|uniref:Uncharacterized protein n=1 Tax=Pseudomicrostroma glucosiphilum TaxID=1684307 RepID=A0A316UGC6_9BASI|nr:hypothetical protein BCV69DRAFT_136399 [Pseudomicrostroma glucosiphilum]PWN22205.1 hypothetical protein BCV69DRAFT_136399 [Pseudomicrostroma glucosiphilum]
MTMETVQLQYLILFLANRVIARKPLGVSASDFALSLATRANTLQHTSLHALLFGKAGGTRSADTLAEILAYRRPIKGSQNDAKSCSTTAEDLHHARTALTGVFHPDEPAALAIASDPVVSTSDPPRSLASQQTDLARATAGEIVVTAIATPPEISHTATPTSDHDQDECGHLTAISADKAELRLQKTTATDEQQDTDVQPRGASEQCSVKAGPEAAAAVGSGEVTDSPGGSDRTEDPAQVARPPTACTEPCTDADRTDQENLRRHLLTTTGEASNGINDILQNCLARCTAESESDSKDTLAFHRLVVSMSSSAIVALQQGHAMLAEIPKSEDVVVSFLAQTKELLERTVNSCLDLLHPPELAIQLKRHKQGAPKKRKLSDVIDTPYCNPRTVTSILLALIQATPRDRDIDIASVVASSCSCRIRDLAALAPHRICNPALQLIRTLCELLDQIVLLMHGSPSGEADSRVLDILQDCRVWLAKGAKCDSQFRRACRKRVMRTFDHIQANL